MQNDSFHGTDLSNEEELEFNPSFRSRHKLSPSKKELRKACLSKQKIIKEEIYPDPEPDISYRNIMM